ncbi:hypothetical protein HMSSN036_25410 [Paenibacillus macerans]|nr:hypothetical protein HMSSN036_25410 [Paenibacillus macerans]
MIIPAMMPSVMDTMRMVMGWAWTYLIMAEMLASSSGLGYSIMIAERFMKTYIIFGASSSSVCWDCCSTAFSLTSTSCCFTGPKTFKPKLRCHERGK